MTKAEKEALMALPMIILIAIGFAWCGSQGGHQIWGIPIYTFAVALALAIQWVAFIPAFSNQTERFYDLTGSLTYLSVVFFAILLTPAVDSRSVIIGGLILIWAIRLGYFLFSRIQVSGHDRRFSEIKTSFFRFLMAWTLQGLWVIVSVSAALAALTATSRLAWDIWGSVGLMIWLLGFGIEVVADQQKSKFRRNPENRDGFIHKGLWSWSRHPNYFGEIILWIGIAVMAFPVLNGWQWVTLSSPILIAFLLIKISGIPMLEAHADQKWGEREDYQRYKQNTSVLILCPPRSNK